MSMIADKVSTLIAIQRREGMTDTQFADTLGYKNRVSWQRIKSRRAPVNDKLLYRALNRWPELEKILSGKATGDSQEDTQSSPQKPPGQNPSGFRRVFKRVFNHPFKKQGKGVEEQ